MGAPQRDVLEEALPLVGHVPYRPLGQSHFVPAPWQKDPETPYQPSVMSEIALRKGIQKAREDLPPQISEERLNKLAAYLAYKYGPIWAGENLMSYEEAVSRLNLDKSPGFPYYYTCEDKGCALTCFGHDIKAQVEAVIAGKEVWLPSTLTLKDELRTADRVKEEKTRVFSAGNIVNLIAAKMLFDKQNDKLRQTLGAHPLTIGIPVPGPFFVKTILGLSRECNCHAGDASGCDQRYYLPFARLVRDLRANHLPPEVREAVKLLYDQDFAGEVIVCGCVYSMFHNKSGRNNTGDDNGLLLDLSIADYVMETTGCQPKEVDDYVNALINGDDSDTAWWGGLTGPGWRDHCKQFNLQIELESEEPKFAVETSFLSHTIRERFVPKMGDVLVAAGNRTKLVSSIEWLRRNNDFSLEENALIHLVGLRICLWPWRIDFIENEGLIDRYVDSIEITPRIRDILKARIPEKQIVDLHLKLESDVSFLSLDSVFYGVPDLIISAILEVVAEMAKTNAKELARRLAQSKKDKALQARATTIVTPKKYAKAVKEVVVSASKGKTQKAPQAEGYETSANSSIRYGGRYKDMVTVSGSDHLEMVVHASPNEMGQVLNEIYIAPSEFGGTRLEKYGALYEKYRFTRLEFEYIPAAASTDKGVIVLAYDRDISDPTPPQNEQGVRQFTAFQGAVDGNIWMKHVCRAKLTAPEEGLFTNAVPGGDDRLAFQGQFYIAIVAPLSVAAGTTIGRLRMHYTCEFFTPQLEGQQNAAELNYNASATPTAPGTDIDFLNSISNGTIAGVKAWTPKLDSNGKYYLDLAQGVYKLVKSIVADTSGGTTFNGAGTVEFNASTILVNEPMPATAPQPWVEVVGGGAASGAAGDYFSSAWQDEYIGIPRGGAKAYVTYDQTAMTDAGGGTNYDLDLQKISNYVPSFGQFFSERYVGQECRNPKAFKTVAQSRSKKPKRAPTTPSSKLPAAPSTQFFRVVDTREGEAGVKEKSRERDPCKYCCSEDPDHLGRNCSKKICSVCGKKAPGHNSWDCPFKPGKNDVRTGKEIRVAYEEDTKLRSMVVSEPLAEEKAKMRSLAMAVPESSSKEEQLFNLVMALQNGKITVGEANNALKRLTLDTQ